MHPDGYVELRDRLKDIIISGGENISRSRSSRRSSRTRTCSEAAVVGLPDEQWGERPMAFVVPRAGGAATAADELIAFARERLAGYKVPARDRVLDELPTTSTGKVQKYVLRTQAGAAAERA